MARKRKGRAINGIILLNKVVGGSSNHDLQCVRRLYQAQKAGHTGALDPLASGMLPICLGEATKFSQFLLDADKTYQVTLKLGIRTTTSDADGEVVTERPITASPAEIEQACLHFVGESMQVPSMYSALKYKGRPLYSYAREGVEVAREARKITIFKLSIENIELPYVEMTVHCSKGTYIRSLVDDIGERLGCGAYVTKLHRTKVAHYPNNKMFTLESLADLAEQNGLQGLDAVLLPMDTAVMNLPDCSTDSKGAVQFQHGQAIDCDHLYKVTSNQLLRVYCKNEENTFLGVGEINDDNKIQPKRVVVY